MAADDDRWLTSSQAAQTAGVSRSTIWRADPDDLPYEEIGGGEERGGDRRYREVDVVRYRDQRRKPVKSRLRMVEDAVVELDARVARLEERTDPEPT